MIALVRRLPRRLWRSLATWPSGGQWLEAAAVGAATLAGMAAVGFAGGFYVLGPAKTEGLALRALTVLIAPAIGEEAPFRGLLLPGRDEGPFPWPWFVAVTAVFTGWHVVEAMTFLPAARTVFLRPDFLACAAILGVGCGVVRWRTGSLWPAVALHWSAVMLWQTWLGGFTLD